MCWSIIRISVTEKGCGRKGQSVASWAHSRPGTNVAPESMWDYVVRSLGIDPATLILTPGVH